ncbi:MAG: NPCBM/NEW2 domain-containing protein [Propionibacteriaceae bacterium]|jgi:hypothetical protein|nr:NPCBM/NEW2 domain-containing protein [Propionibacteriaceae bacterium]
MWSDASTRQRQSSKHKTRQAIIPIIVATLLLAGMSQLLRANAAPGTSDVYYASDANWLSTKVGWGSAQKDQGLENLPLRLRSGTVDNIKTYSKGLMAHAASEIVYDVEGAGYSRFISDIGVNYSKKGTIGFTVKIDGVTVFEVAKIAEADVAQTVDVPIPTDAKRLHLITTDGGDGNANDHSVWADARFTLTAEALTVVAKLQAKVDSSHIATGAATPINAVGLNLLGAEIPESVSNISFSSAHPEIASVDENGLVTGLTNGLANILITYLNEATVYQKVITFTVGSGQNLEGADVPRQTPLMGWASWNNYRVNISEDILKEQMDALVATGLADAGYTYFNMDDGFFGGRGSDGYVQIHPTRFPNGVKVIADYAHALGLKAGIYTDAGVHTCAYQWDAEGDNGVDVGLLGNDEKDLRMYLQDWGFDFIKVDWCGGKTLGLDQEERYTAIGDIIQQIREDTGRYIVYNVCSWAFPGAWVTGVGDSWRTGADIANNFASVMTQVDNATSLAQYSGPGHVNDLDMMQVGRGMTPTEDKTHFAMWAMMSTPLMLGNDLTKISQQTLDIVTNKEIIAINQDPLGDQAIIAKTTNNGQGQVWVKELEQTGSGVKAVALLNRSTTAMEMTLDWDEIGLSGDIQARNLWTHRNINVGDSYSVTVPAHGTVVLKVSSK